MTGGGNMTSQGGGLFQSPLDGGKEERAEVGRTRRDDSQRRVSLLQLRQKDPPVAEPLVLPEVLTSPLHVCAQVTYPGL